MDVVGPGFRVAGRRQEVTAKSPGLRDHLFPVGYPDVGKSVVAGQSVSVQAGLEQAGFLFLGAKACFLNGFAEDALSGTRTNGGMEPKASRTWPHSGQRLSRSGNGMRRRCVGVPTAVVKGRAAAPGQESWYGVENRVSNTKTAFLDGGLCSEPSVFGDGHLDDVAKAVFERSASFEHTGGGWLEASYGHDRCGWVDVLGDVLWLGKTRTLSGSI